MPAFIANIGPFSWGGPHPGSFQPIGKITYVGDADKLTGELSARRANPAAKTRRVSAGVRIIVGFNVGGTPRWEMVDLVRIVRRVRTKQVGQPDSTFVAQTGMYTHTGAKAKRGKVVTESGGQVIIKNLPHLKTDDQEFQEQMLELAETIARELEQEIVIVDYQERGLSVEEWVVTP